METGIKNVFLAGCPFTLLLRIEAVGFPTFGLLPQRLVGLRGFSVSGSGGGSGGLRVDPLSARQLRV